MSTVVADLAVLFPQITQHSEQLATNAVLNIAAEMGLQTHLNSISHQFEVDAEVSATTHSDAIMQAEALCERFQNEADAMAFGEVSCEPTVFDLGDWGEGLAKCTSVSLSLEVPLEESSRSRWTSSKIQDLVAKFGEGSGCNEGATSVAGVAVAEVSLYAADSIEMEAFQSLMALGHVEDVFQQAVVKAIDAPPTAQVLAVVLETPGPKRALVSNCTGKLWFTVHCSRCSCVC